MVRQVVGNETFAAHGLAVMLERRIEILAPVAGREAVILLKAARIRMVGPLAAIMPFAEGAGHVSGRLERFGHRSLVEVQPLLPGANAAHPTARMIAARQKLGASRCANRTNIKPVEH